MSQRLRESLMGTLGQLRHEPTAKRIRAELAGATVVDSTRAVLVWEPGRVVPAYAVPAEDVLGELVPAAVEAADPQDGVGFHVPDLSNRPVLDPSIPFGVHTADGEAVDVRVTGQSRPGAGFRLADSDLAGYIVLEFAAFDAWYEEDEPNLGHPRDPFHRLDVLASSRAVRLEVDGEVFAESSRAVLIFETLMPTRYYLPREDIHVELRPSDTRTYCAYKGQASYWSATAGGRNLADLAWSYQQPLREAALVSGLISFFDERFDVVVDGKRQQRPVTRWSAKPDA